MLHGRLSLLYAAPSHGYYSFLNANPEYVTTE
jgi:hypothetical protein